MSKKIEIDVEILDVIGIPCHKIVVPQSNEKFSCVNKKKKNS